MNAVIRRRSHTSPLLLYSIGIQHLGAFTFARTGGWPPISGWLVK
jgi:hypothetical protein